LQVYPELAEGHSSGFCPLLNIFQEQERTQKPDGPKTVIPNIKEEVGNNRL
jgi:hypothetical protein